MCQELPPLEDRLVLMQFSSVGWKDKSVNLRNRWSNVRWPRVCYSYCYLQSESSVCYCKCALPSWM